MEAMKLSKFGRTFYVLFSRGFEKSRTKMIEEAGGSEQYCLDVLCQIGGNSENSLSQAELVQQVSYLFTFPEKFADPQVVKNLALLGSWTYWLEGLETTGSMKRLENRLNALKNAK